MGLIFIKAIKIFEYKKNNNEYQNRVKLHKQVVEKVLSIVETLYPKYSLSCLFYNAISHFVYTKNALQVEEMNKKMGRKQLLLCN